MKVFIGVVVGFVGFAGLVILEMFLRGFALVKLWKWFAVAHFGAEPIPISVALGISLIVGILTHQSNQWKNHELDFIAVGTAALLSPLLALFIGWIITLFM